MVGWLAWKPRHVIKGGKTNNNPILVGGRRGKKKGDVSVLATLCFGDGLWCFLSKGEGEIRKGSKGRHTLASLLKAFKDQPWRN